MWAESVKKYFPIPLKQVYFSKLLINPDDPLNYPISLKELEIIKRNRLSKQKLSLHELNHSYEVRQEIIKEAREKTKTAKKARRISEVRKVHKTKATSTEIRRGKNKLSMEGKRGIEDNYLIDDIDDDEIVAYPTEWEEVKKEMNLIYFDKEEEGEI